MKKRVEKNSVQSVTPHRCPIRYLSRCPISLPFCCPICRPLRSPISPPSPCPISPPISLSNQCSSRCPVSPRSWSQSFPPLVVQSDLPRVVPSVPLPVVQSVPTPVVHTVSPFRCSISPSIAKVVGLKKTGGCIFEDMNQTLLVFFRPVASCKKLGFF